MNTSKTTHLYQPRYSDAVWLTIQELADLLCRDRSVIIRALAGLPEGEPLRAKDMPWTLDAAGHKATAESNSLELASCATRLPFSRWGELVRMDL